MLIFSFEVITGTKTDFLPVCCWLKNACGAFRLDLSALCLDVQGFGCLIIVTSRKPILCSLSLAAFFIVGMRQMMHGGFFEFFEERGEQSKKMEEIRIRNWQIQLQ